MPHNIVDKKKEIIMSKPQSNYTFVTIDKQSYLTLSTMKLKELRRLLTRTSNEIKRRERVRSANKPVFSKKLLERVSLRNLANED